MRVSLTFTVLLLAASLLAAACGGPDDNEARLAEACERQVKEVEAESGGTAEAKSSQDATKQEQLVECAGQEVTSASSADDDEATEFGEVEDGEKGEGEAGGTSEGEDGDGGGESGEDAAAGGELDPAAREMFTETCASCHALADAEASGQVGPNLDETTMTAEEIEAQIVEGGGAMPPRLLQGEDAALVAEYVAAAAAA